MPRPAALSPEIRETIRSQKPLLQSSPDRASARDLEQLMGLDLNKEIVEVPRRIVFESAPDPAIRYRNPHDESVIEKAIAPVFSATILDAVRGPCILAARSDGSDSFAHLQTSNTLPLVPTPLIQAKMSGSEKRQ